MTKKKHQKTKIVYREKQVKEVDLTPKLKQEIADLEDKKNTAPKGFKGILYKAQINKAINDRRQYINSKVGTRNLQAATSNLNARIEFERKKSELNELRKKNNVNFDSLGFSSSQPKKELKFNDLF